MMRKLRFALALVMALLLSSGLALADTDSAEAEFTPWSGYWWPTNGGGLSTGLGYRGHPAPLEKYELLKDGYYPGQASQWDLDYHFDTTVPSWYGLCHAWAAASVYEQIEFYPSSVDNIIFYVGDKKGLITACHTTDVNIKANSHPPEVFHFWLLQYIKEQGISFYAELEPGVEVWNYPVYKYEMEIEDLGDRIKVSCQIWYVDNQVDPDIQGSVTLTKIYTYLLYQSGGEVTGGEWTGASVSDHPAQLTLPIAPVADNPYLDYEFIRNLATSRDDYLESDEPAELAPGGYNLILMNEDLYKISCDVGDTVLLGLDKMDDFNEGIQLSIADKSGSQVYLDVVDEHEEVQLVAEDPPYNITVSRTDYGGGGVYRLDCDLKKRFEFANTKVQKGLGWGGFAITNSAETEYEKIYVVGYRQDGSVIQTFMGPFSLAAGEKRTLLISDFETRNIERDDLYGVKILAPSPLKVVNVFGYYGRSMSSFTASERTVRLCIPDISSRWNYSKSVSWGVYNPTMEDVDVQLSLFSLEGELLDDLDLPIYANQALHYNNSTTPFGTSYDDGWIMVVGGDGSALEGYVEWRENGFFKAEALSPLRPGNEFFVPHVNSTDFWGMRVTVINVSDFENPVTFTLVNGNTVVEEEVILTSRQKRVWDIEQIFPTVDQFTLGGSALLVRATREIVGYYAFQTPADDVYYTFLNSDNIQQELVVPHVASNHEWWTGLNLFNPYETPVSVSLLPYDADGRLLETHVVDRLLGSNQKDVFTISEFYDDVADEVSFLKIEVEDGPGVVGVYGYGNPDCTMLSGGIMQ
jgi:hypothetical protein